MDLQPAADYWVSVSVLLNCNKFTDLNMVQYRTDPCPPDQHALPKPLAVTLTELVPKVWAFLNSPYQFK